MVHDEKVEPKLGKIRPNSELPERKRDHFDWEALFAKIPPGHFAEVEGVNKYTLRRKAERYGGGKVRVVIRKNAAGEKHVYLVRKD
jgi:hypothetical protein